MKSVRRLTCLLKGSKLTALPSLSLWVFVFLVYSLHLSHTFKTISSVKKLSKSTLPPDISPTSSLWTVASRKKSSLEACTTSASSAKCKKERKSVQNLRPVGDQPPAVPRSLTDIQQLTPDTLEDMNKFVRKKRHYCKLHHFESFTCRKLKLSLWLAKKMESNNTRLASWLEIVKNGDLNANSTSSKDLSALQPGYWPERILYRLIKAWGDPEDLFVFYKYKDFMHSRELKISLPYQVQLKVAPRLKSPEAVARSKVSSASALAQETQRFFWDPGFNLKLKLPFFRDELKVAVSTGPSFVAGIGVGIALLILKTMFAPFLLGLKWMMYNFFLKESSPWDLMKMFFLSHAPSEPGFAAIPPPAIDAYRPPPVHHPYDNGPPGPPFRGRLPPPPPPRHHHPPYPFPPPPYRGPKGYGPPPPPYMYSSPTISGLSPYSFEDAEYAPPPPPPYEGDLSHQYTQPTPFVSTPGGVSPTMSQLEQIYRQQLLEEGLGLKVPYKNFLSVDPTNSLDSNMGATGEPGHHPMDSMDMGMETQEPPQDSPNYIPSAGLQAEVDHFDPFYSPLLSKIDSIFTHLGHQDEGCRERVVCSIYKFPVKYAPYSNLISAQLSKHQSELKRPVSSSTKILRYFRYMKAAKDGQGGENCGDLYPKCDSDTDAVSSLPMITTFHQLSELMTAEGSSPGVALAAAAAAAAAG